MAKVVVDADTRRRMAWQGGRGKNQLAVIRALIGYGPVLTTRELVQLVYPRLKKADKDQSASRTVATGGRHDKDGSLNTAEPALGSIH